MKQTILFSILLALSACGCRQATKKQSFTIEDFIGKWSCESVGEIEIQNSSFELILEKDSTQENTLIGWHCSVVRGGRKIDCADKEYGEEPSLRGCLRGDTLYLRFCSSWEVEGEAKLYFDLAAGDRYVLIWELGKFESTKEDRKNVEHYMPQTDTLKKVIEEHKKDKLQLDIKLTDSFEQFDRKLYDQLHDKRMNYVQKELPDGTSLKIIDNYWGFEQKNLPPDSYFSLTKTYWRDGKIRNKGWEWNFRKGVWYEFDMDGNLTSRTDYDAPYTFTWNDVLEYCRQNSIDVIRRSWGNYESTYISREMADGKYRWIISHEVEYGGHEILTLDGKTGELLDKYTTYDE